MSFILNAIIADLGFNLEKFLFDTKLNRENLTLVSIFILGNILNNNDFIVKMKQVKKFIDNGDKVKITLRFRGREMAHQTLGATVLDRVKEDTEELCKVETVPKLEGRQMVMILAPK